MFICQIGLLSLITEENEPIFYTMAEYSFDPGLQVGEELWINCNIDKKRSLKVKVISREKIVYQKGCYQDYKDENVLVLIINVEAEDREQILEIKNFLAKHNPGIKPSLK
ncbi:hypothetical protein [Nostoc sp. UHCC 0870]|uniref:hypothetical protein n=1 Tax=Nostoc sp. UHCC 0870 TaxID=2914041 RepID=UPI001EE151FF|nr:hypothetical protein [Nostoc sp. UHCC 0870]UKP01442.1 hypothetical protein L6494_29895 [Nostoc sp. UHCC 0870]